MRTKSIFFAFCLMLGSLIVCNCWRNCKFTNLRCKVLNKNAFDVKHCYIKAVSRNDNFLRIYLRVLEPIRTAEVRVSLSKRANGWRPFLYNVTFDGCKFLNNRKSNPVANLFYSTLVPYTNMNHSCPYTHDIVVEKYRITEEIVRLPFPEGEYAIDTTCVINKLPALEINSSCIRLS